MLAGGGPAAAAARRLGVLDGHCQNFAGSRGVELRLENTAAVQKSLPVFDPFVMEVFLDGMRDLKRQVYNLLKTRSDLLPPTEEGLSKAEHRQLVRDLLRLVLEAGFSPLAFYDRDVKKYFYLAELAAAVDLSWMVKMGVQYSLWGGSVLSLGTQLHRRRYYDDIARFTLPGCFAMTELKHGSNVAMLQTEAVLDPSADEWVINTPDDGAIKWWIGNAAEDGRAATVFARLKLPSNDAPSSLVDHGVHAFVVPLRDGNGPLPGIEIRDCGYKVGLNGVDNGALRFTNVRVPRTALLDRFGAVDRAGRYSSALPSPSKRFAATLGELTGGRVGLTCGSAAVLKAACTIAVRYSDARVQFGPSADAPEVSVLDYQSQQFKLMPLVAGAYALHFAKNYLVERYAEMRRTRNPALADDVHALSAGLKAYTTAFTNDALSTARLACGGHGYAAVNRLGAMRSDHDIFQTFEGDNTVLLQQVAAMLLKEYRNRFRGSPMSATYAYLEDLLSSSLPQNPIVTHDTDPGHLRDPAFLARALRHRSARLLSTVAGRLRKHGAALGSFAGWNCCMDHLLALAKAHVESVIHTQFQAAVDRCMDADCRKSLSALADLYALNIIHGDIIFRNDDFVSPAKSKAIHKLVLQLCRQLRTVAVPLVDAWAIPDHILRAPIGLSTASGRTEQDFYKEYLESVGFDVESAAY